MVGKLSVSQQRVEDLHSCQHKTITVTLPHVNVSYIYYIKVSGHNSGKWLYIGTVDSILLM
jgi:hypothetical protein